jgi:hypothetical protein
MTYTVAIIISVLLSALITFSIVWWIEINQATKRIELLHLINDEFRESINMYKDLILHLAENIDNAKAELEELKKLQEEQQ